MIQPPNSNLNGIVLTEQGLWKKPKMTAAPSSASLSEALHNQSATCVQRYRMWHQPDCEEKRDPDERQRSQEQWKTSLTQTPI